jgi:hypothetical protein
LKSAPGRALQHACFEKKVCNVLHARFYTMNCVICTYTIDRSCDL